MIINKSPSNASFIVFCLLQLTLMGLICSIDDLIQHDPLEFFNHDVNQTSIKKVLTYHPAKTPVNDNLMLEMMNKANEGIEGDQLRRGNHKRDQDYIFNDRKNNQQILSFNLSMMDLMNNITDYNFHFNIIITNLNSCWVELSAEKRQRLQTSIDAYMTSSRLLEHDFRIVTSSLVKIIRTFIAWSLQRLDDNSNTPDQCSNPNVYYHHDQRHRHGNYHINLHSLLNFSDYSTELRDILITVSNYWDDIEVVKKQSLVNAFTTYIKNDTNISHDILLANAIFVNASTLFILYWSWAISVILMMLSVLSLIGAFYVTKMIYTVLKYIMSVMMVPLRMLLVICSYIPIYCYVLFIAWITFNYLIE